MRFLSAAALLSTAAATPFTYRTRAFYPNMTANVVIATPQHILLSAYDGASFTTTLDVTVSGVPSWTTFIAPDKLFAVDEWTDQTYLYTLDLAANTLTEVTHETGSVGVVHLEPNKAGTRMVGAAYGNGTVDIWNIENGLTLVATVESTAELGPNPDRQTAPHPHQSVADPSGRFFAVNDLGTDTIMILDGEDDAWTVANEVRTEPAGCGPRHGAFYPPGAEEATHYLVVCELLNLVNVYSLEYATGTINFTPVQSLSTLGSPSNGTAAAGELVVASPEDVYISNRLTGGAADTIAHFRVAGANTGEISLEFQAETSSYGILPRHFSLTPDGTELLVGNQDGELGVVALRRDVDTGALESTPVASVNNNVFGTAEASGPQFVQQIV